MARERRDGVQTRALTGVMLGTGVIAAVASGCDGTSVDTSAGGAPVEDSDRGGSAGLGGTSSSGMGGLLGGILPGSGEGGSGGGTSSPSAPGGGSPGGGASTSSSPDGGEASTVELPERIARYLRASSPSLIIEVDVVAGLRPYDQSNEHVVAFLSELLDKPEGITVQVDETLDSFGDDYEWTFDELSAFADERTEDDGDGPPRIHVLSIDGRYVSEEGSTTLGLAWGNEHVALFQTALRGRCNGLLDGLQGDVCELAERTVWAHELGHTIGLVDNGLPMVEDHKDPDNGAHEAMEGCLMYWAYDGPQLFDTLLGLGSGGRELALCEGSRRDVAAAR